MSIPMLYPWLEQERSRGDRWIARIAGQADAAGAAVESGEKNNEAKFYSNYTKINPSFDSEPKRGKGSLSLKSKV